MSSILNLTMTGYFAGVDTVKAFQNLNYKDPKSICVSGAKAVGSVAGLAAGGAVGLAVGLTFLASAKAKEAVALAAEAAWTPALRITTEVVDEEDAVDEDGDVLVKSK